MKLVNLLQYFVTTGGYRLVDIATISEIHAPDLSRIVNGKRACGRGNLLKLLKAFTPEQQSTLVQAWLLDQIPAEYSHLVNVEKCVNGSKKNRIPNPGTVEGAVEVLKNAAETNSALTKVILNMALMQTGANS